MSGSAPGATRLYLARDFTAIGRATALRSHVAAGRLERVRRGAYAEPAERHDPAGDVAYLTKVSAVLAMRRDAVAAGPSAAALMGLPVFGAWPPDVYLLAATPYSRHRNGVVEFGRRGDEEVVELGGLLLTSPELTVLESCRVLAPWSALSVVDAAIRTEPFGTHAPITSLERIRVLHDSRLPYRGHARVRRVLDFARDGADSSFESGSRVVIDELGFPQPVLQHAIFLPDVGYTARFDFAWPEHRVDGEADGFGKYVLPKGDTVDPLERVKREKRRDNAVREIGWTPVHWERRDILDRARLRRHLLAAGLPIVTRPRRVL
jgi:hypothetical protein